GGKTTPIVRAPESDSAAEFEVKPSQPVLYPRRALLIGIRDYVYARGASPYERREPATKIADPLGLEGLRSNLINYMKHVPNQVAVLSDAGGGPLPNKETI